MRILFVHEVNYLTKPIFEMHEFPEHLATMDHEVGFLHFPEGLVKEELKNLSWRTEIAGRALPRARITLFTPRVPNGNLAGRLWHAITAFTSLRKVVNEFKPDVIVCLSVPTSGWQAVLVAKSAGVPLVYRALDVSHLIRRGPWRSLVKLAERFVIRSASEISANNSAMGDYALSLGALSSRIHIHYPPMELSLLPQGDRTRGRIKLNLDMTTKVVMYMGSFFYFSGLIEAIKAFAASNPSPDFRFVLIGGGELTEKIQALVLTLEEEGRVILPGFMGFEELPDYLSAADVLINPMTPSLVSDTALPNKVIQYLATGLPVVSTRLKGLVTTFEQYKSITWVETASEAMEAALIGCQADAPLIDCSGLLREQFGEIAVLKFEAFLKQTVEKR